MIYYYIVMKYEYIIIGAGPAGIQLGYFFLLSIIIWPMYQEYFDPLILILAFTFFGSKIYLSYKNSIILFIYLLIFLVSANVYYAEFNLINQTGWTKFSENGNL